VVQIINVCILIAIFQPVVTQTSTYGIAFKGFVKQTTSKYWRQVRLLSIF